MVFKDDASRGGALARALTFFDSNGFRDRLAALVAIPSTSQVQSSPSPRPIHSSSRRRHECCTWPSRVNAKKQPPPPRWSWVRAIAKPA